LKNLYLNYLIETEVKLTMRHQLNYADYEYAIIFDLRNLEVDESG